MKRAPFLAALCALVAILLATPAFVRADDEAYGGGRMLRRAVRVLRGKLPSLTARIEELGRTYGDRARACITETEERDVVFAMLSEIPTSHLGLWTRFGRDVATAELMGAPHLTLGLDLVQLGERVFVARVMNGGPAHAADIRRGDEVVALDGVPTLESPRLDFRTDDAALPDPPSHLVVCEPKVPVTFTIRVREDAETRDVGVVPGFHSSLRADRASARIVRRDGAAIGVLPLSIMYFRHVRSLIESALAGPLAESDAIVVDLRGRGGSPPDIWAVLALLSREHARGRPLVFLTDARTRSAKEIVAQRVKQKGIGVLVGETTAGAVRRSNFFRIGEDTWMLCPMWGLEFTFSGEFHGVTPHVEQADRLPYARGADPILEAGLAEAARALETAAAAR